MSTDKEAVSVEVKCPLYSCRLAVPLASGSRVFNKFVNHPKEGGGEETELFFHLIFHFSPRATIGCMQKLYQCYIIHPYVESILVELKEDMGVAYILIIYVKAILMLV